MSASRAGHETSQVISRRKVVSAACKAANGWSGVLINSGNINQRPPPEVVLPPPKLLNIQFHQRPSHPPTLRRTIPPNIYQTFRPTRSNHWSFAAGCWLDSILKRYFDVPGDFTLIPESPEELDDGRCLRA
jgi:hypothetical protein